MIRLITGLSLGVISLLFIFLGKIYVAFEILLLSLVALHEFYDLARKKKYLPSEITGMISCIVFIALIAFNHTNWVLHFATILVIVTLIVFLLRKEFHVSPLLDAGLTVMGVLYIPGLFSYGVLIRGLPQGEWWLTLVVIGTAMYDTFAYYVGKSFGKHPLWPKVSPGKTVEGALGGLIMAVISVTAIGMWRHFPIVPVIGLGILLACMGQLGDLCESLLKRDVGVKDAGQILAGHGGILDRCDSLFFSCPAAYLYFYLVIGIS